MAFKCKDCGQVFPGKGEVSEHLEDIHNKPRSCEYCGRPCKPYWDACIECAGI